ncbi:transcription initiation at TATA-containing promoter protein [Recurvomyces mirabilis]|nr:transcription initiation at TATA-containing promoter protein [Recurvomyces mirabilis]
MNKYNNFKAQTVAAARNTMMQKLEEARHAELEAVRDQYVKDVGKVEKKHDAIVAEVQQELDDPPHALVEVYETALAALAEAMSGDAFLGERMPAGRKRGRAQVNEDRSKSRDASEESTTSSIDSGPHKRRQRRYRGPTNTDDLSFCLQLLDKITGPQYLSIAIAFLQPVDPTLLDIPTYFDVIKKPMDLSTIQTKLSDGEYEDTTAFKSEFDLVVDNCLLFNSHDNPVYKLGMDLATVIEFMWRTGTTPDEVEGVKCVRIEEVVDQKHHENGQMLYLVKWVGYRDQTWELGNSLLIPSQERL